ncbi:MAG: dihydrolipoyl dehydrogenase [Candidatus Omnitrophota bacterium]
MYDIAIIGSGPGGYAAAVKASGNGLKVCVVEKNELGGTCLNVGCIPTKSFVHSVNTLRTLKESSIYGIDCKDISVNISKIIDHKNEVVQNLKAGLKSLLESQKIDIIKGSARFLDTQTLTVDSKQIKAKNFIIATGSSPAEIGPLKFDHKFILSTDDILSLKEIPKKLLIIGGGVIGCEFASIYNFLGAEVTIVELTNQLLPREDREISRRLENSFKKRGITVLKGSKVMSFSINAGIKFQLEDSSEINVDKALLSIGRIHNTGCLNLQSCGIIMDKDRIRVDDHLRTNIDHIYAIGDVTGTFYLAHTASYQGEIAVSSILGENTRADYAAVPTTIFTYPEISSVGMNEAEAKDLFEDTKVVKIPYAAISKAHIDGETDGFIKIVYDKKTNKILGVRIFGHMASELIPSFTIAMNRNISVFELSKVIYAHPTLAEGIHDALKGIKKSL